MPRTAHGRHKVTHARRKVTQVQARRDMQLSAHTHQAALERQHRDAMSSALLQPVLQAGLSSGHLRETTALMYQQRAGELAAARIQTANYQEQQQLLFGVPAASAPQIAATAAAAAASVNASMYAPELSVFVNPLPSLGLPASAAAAPGAAETAPAAAAQVPPLAAAPASATTEPPPTTSNKRVRSRAENVAIKKARYERKMQEFTQILQDNTSDDAIADVAEAAVNRAKQAWMDAMAVDSESDDDGDCA